jgi:hypothetical protein
VRKLYYNPLIEEDDFSDDNRSEWEKYIEGIDLMSKLSADEWFAKIDSDTNPF